MESGVPRPMRWSIVHVEAMGEAWLARLQGFLVMTENGYEGWSIHCSTADKLHVHHSFMVREWHQHTFLGWQSPLGVHWSGLVLPEPLGGLSLQFQIVLIEPGFVHSHYLLQKTGSGIDLVEHVSAVNKMLHNMPGGQDIWHQLCALECQLKVSSQNLMHWCCRQSSLLENCSYCQWSVCVDHSLHCLDVWVRSGTFLSWRMPQVHQSCPPTLEFCIPAPGSGCVHCFITKHSLKGPPGNSMTPPKTPTKEQINMLHRLDVQLSGCLHLAGVTGLMSKGNVWISHIDNRVLTHACAMSCDSRLTWAEVKSPCSVIMSERQKWYKPCILARMILCWLP